MTIVSCAVGVLGCLVFVGAYHVRTHGRWRRSEVGRLLMLVNLDLAAILLLILSNRVFGDWSGRREITLVLAAVYALQPWWWLRLLWRAQADDAASHRAPSRHRHSATDPAPRPPARRGH